jgi:hypothetical protein
MGNGRYPWFTLWWWTARTGKLLLDKRISNYRCGDAWQVFFHHIQYEFMACKPIITHFNMKSQDPFCIQYSLKAQEAIIWGSCESLNIKLPHLLYPASSTSRSRNCLVFD